MRDNTNNERRTFRILLGCFALFVTSSVFASDEVAPSQTSMQEVRSYIVSSKSSSEAATRVRQFGGKVISQIPIIDAVGAALNGRQLALLKAAPDVRVFENRDVQNEWPQEGATQQD